MREATPSQKNFEKDAESALAAFLPLFDAWLDSLSLFDDTKGESLTPRLGPSPRPLAHLQPSLCHLPPRQRPPITPLASPQARQPPSSPPSPT